MVGGGGSDWLAADGDGELLELERSGDDLLIARDDELLEAGGSKDVSLIAGGGGGSLETGMVFD